MGNVVLRSKLPPRSLASYVELSMYGDEDVWILLPGLSWDTVAAEKIMREQEGPEIGER